jgi:serine/threonine protein kinase
MPPPFSNTLMEPFEIVTNPPNPPTPLPKLDLPGYEILAVIGSGGMGTVYQARDTKSRRLVAIKMLRTDSRVSRTIERFVREIEALGRVKHPNLVAAIDAGYTGGAYYYVMEFVEGRSTEQMIRRGPLEEARCVHILRQMAEALDCLHASGIVHRDIKPSNILITKDGTAKLCDLGISKSVEEEEEAQQGITTEGMMLGTPRTMSPEQIRGEPLDGRSDLYSLGATLFHLATGRPPFDAPSGGAIVAMHLTQPAPDPRSLRPELSRGFVAILRKLLEKSPSKRFSHARELAAAVDRLSEPAEPALVAAMRRLSTPRNAALAVGVLAAALVVALAVSLLLRGGSIPESPPPPPPTESSQPVSESPIGDAPPRESGRPASDTEAERARVHEEARTRLQDYLEVWRATRDASKVGEILSMLDYHLRRFQGTSFEAGWREERDSFVREARAWAASEWTPRRDAARSALRRGEFGEALAAAEGLPHALREIPSGSPTEAEIERRELAREIDAAASTAFERDRAALPQADIGGALAILARMSETLPESRQRDLEELRLDVEKRYFASVEAAPLTAARFQELRRALEPLASRRELAEYAAPILAELQRRRDRQGIAARIRLSAAHAGIALGATLRNREFEAAHAALRELLVEPAHALALEGERTTPESVRALAAAPRAWTLRELQERRQAVEAVAAEAAQDPAVRELAAALSDLLAVLTMEELCYRAWVGVEAADPNEWKNLHLPMLWAATRVTRLPQTPGRPFACRVERSIGGDAEFTIAPVSSATLSAEDIARAARRSYASPEQADKDSVPPWGTALLLYFGGDEAGARRILEAHLREGGTFVGLGGYLERIRSGAKPDRAASGGPPEPPATAAPLFRVNARELSPRRYQLSYGFNDDGELGDFAWGESFFDGRLNVSGELKREVRRSDLALEGSGLLRWLPEVEGNVVLEIEFRLEGGDATALAFLMHYARSAAPRQQGRRTPDQGYALAFSLRPGRPATGSMELRKRGRALDSQPYRILMGQAYVLRFAREGGKLQVSLREQGTSKIFKVEGTDDEWNRGQFAIALANGRLELRRIRITATVSQAWIDSK